MRGVGERVEFIEGDVFTNDLREATVVTLFLGHEPSISLDAVDLANYAHSKGVTINVAATRAAG